MNDRDITTLALTHLLDASGASEHKIAAMGNLQRQVEIFLEKRVVAGGLGRREACAVLANMA